MKQCSFKLIKDNKSYLFLSTVDKDNNRTNCKVLCNGQSAPISTKCYEKHLTQAQQ